METLINHHQEIGVFIARVILGILFFYQGYDAVFNLKIKTIIITYQNSFSNKGIPKLITACGAWFTSYSGLIGGFMLIFGFYEYVALYLLALNLLVASFAFSVNNPLWDTKHVLIRLLLLLFLLIVPVSWHTYSIDNLIF